MRLPTADDVRRIAATYVQPTYSGIVDTVQGLKAKLTDVMPRGTPEAQMSFPYGFVSAPIKGVVGLLSNLHGSPLAGKILGMIDTKRPIPSAQGEVILYCMTADGSSTPVQITLGVDGTLLIQSTLKVQVQADDIELGEGTLQKVFKCETFQTFFNEHQHLVMGIQSSPPITPSDSSHLSTVVKSE